MKPAVVDGEPPTPRGLCTATVVGDQVLVFGGSSDFAPDTMQCLTYFAETYILKVGELFIRQKSFCSFVQCLILTLLYIEVVMIFASLGLCPS